MAKRQFKAESKRLIDLMINSSILKGSVSKNSVNASDAIDKIYYKALTDEISNLTKTIIIKISVDKEKRLLRLLIQESKKKNLIRIGIRKKWLI